jgi:CheY-like chemotaxis protein
MAESRSRHATAEIDRPEVPASVLLVDDDADVRNAVKEFLHDEGFTVVSAMNGADALNTLRTGFRPNVIVLDIMMPVMDGWDFRAAQLADTALREIPVIVISASGFGRDTIRSQLNTFEVVSKPIELDDFLKAVRQACGFEEAERSSSSTA